MLDRNAAVAKAREARRNAPPKKKLPVRREPLAISIAEAEELSPIRRTKLYELMESGALRSTKNGKNRMIDFESFKEVVLGTAQGAE
jgi:hypothetical protein